MIQSPIDDLIDSQNRFSPEKTGGADKQQQKCK